MTVDNRFIIVAGRKVKREVIEGNEKLTEYQIGERCPMCKMLKDPGEPKGLCKYCLGDF